MVIAFSVILTTFGAVIVNSYVNNAPILAQASLRRYAYRALASGLNAYTSAINANPYLADCNTDDTSNPECAAITYQSWTQVEGTNVGNGVVPELYMFDNPQEVVSSTTGAVTDLEVQIVGAAGFSNNNYVYYSTIAHFIPANDFLNNVWWSNYESSEFPGSASNCSHYWASGRTSAGISPCTAVEWQSGDNVFGPVYSNDSLFTSGTPTFTGTVTTADPSCEFVGRRVAEPVRRTLRRPMAMPSRTRRPTTPSSEPPPSRVAATTRGRRRSPSTRRADRRP